MSNMICPICKKNIEKGKLFIGYMHPNCIDTEKTRYTVKKTESSEKKNK